MYFSITSRIFNIHFYTFVPSVTALERATKSLHCVRVCVFNNFKTFSFSY